MALAGVVDHAVVIVVLAAVLEIVADVLATTVADVAALLIVVAVAAVVTSADVVTLEIVVAVVEILVDGEAFVAEEVAVEVRPTLINICNSADRMLSQVAPIVQDQLLVNLNSRFFSGTTLIIPRSCPKSSRARRDLQRWAYCSTRQSCHSARKSD